MISVYLLWFDYWTLRNEKLQKYRIILLQHTSCLHKWLVLSLICLLLLFFSGKFLNVCKPRTTLYPLWQPGPTGLAFYGSELTCLQAGWDGDCRLVLFHVIKKFSCKWNLSFFMAVPPNRLPFYLGSMLHIISSLFSNFRSWDYPENFGTYSQLDRKSKACFFFFLNIFVSCIEWDKILISRLSPPKFMYFADQNEPKVPGVPHGNFDNLQIKQLGLEKQI